MGNGIEQPADARQVDWKRVRRVNSHRTSRTTDEALRKMIGEVAAQRGSAPAVDTVILAAVRIVARGKLAVLLDAIREIETDKYPAPVPHEPGS